MLHISNQIVSAFMTNADNIIKKQYGDFRIQYAEYESFMWGCFNGEIIDNDQIVLQVRVSNTLIDYDSFVSKKEIVEFVGNCDNPTIFQIYHKNQKAALSSFIADENNGLSMIPSMLEVIKECINLKDNQKNKLYAWESLNIMPIEKVISSKSAVKLCNKICEDYAITPHFIKDTLKKNILGSCFTIKESVFSSAHAVIIVGDSKDSTYVHELAHVIVDNKYKGFGGESHGEIFVRVYIDLLANYLGYDRLAMISSATQTLKIASDETLREAEKKAKLYSI